MWIPWSGERKCGDRVWSLKNGNKVKNSVTTEQVHSESCVKSELSNKPRVAMVVTRSLSEDSSISRVRILRTIREMFEGEFDTTVFRVRNVVEAGRAREFIAASWMFCVGMASLRFVPLQCALFGASSVIAELTRQIADGRYDVVYLDSVRSLGLLRSLHKRRLKIRVVVDFDDLMSRRMEIMAENRWPVSLGYLQNKIPKSIRNAVEGWLSGAIVKYEARALRCVEKEICRNANAVVLVSPAERDMLRRRLTPDADADVCAVIPSRRVVTSQICVRAPYRFVFIGSDIHGQNKLSLEFLVDLWREVRPSAPLHIYGRQKSSWPTVRNVHWCGYVEQLREVYSDDSIALLPALRAGGIKTKMIEAWAYARPVLANPTAFEGLEGLESRGYPLVVSESAWASYILSPEAYQDNLRCAAEMGNSFVREELSMERYVAQWLQIMWPRENSLDCGEEVGAC